MSDDFPVTRRTIDRLDEWLMELASPLLPPERIPVRPADSKGFRWVFREQTDRALCIGKSVRMISGIRAALLLAEAGYINDCGTILRTVLDFANEVISVCEGRSHGSTKAQRSFVEQYFIPLPTTSDEYDQRRREKWVTRDELFAAHNRLAAGMSENPDRVMKDLRYLAHLYDKFVHGSYPHSYGPL